MHTLGALELSLKAEQSGAENLPVTRVRASRRSFSVARWDKLEFGQAGADDGARRVARSAAC